MENKINNKDIQSKLGLSHAKLIFNMNGKFKIQLATGQAKITDYFRFSERAASCFLDQLKKDEYVIAKLAQMQNLDKTQELFQKIGRMERPKVELKTISMFDQCNPVKEGDILILEQDKQSVISKFKKLFKK